MAEEKMRLKERAIEIIQSEKCREKGWKRKETVGQHKVYNIHAMGVPEGEGGKKERRSQTKNKQTNKNIYIYIRRSNDQKLPKWKTVTYISKNLSESQLL